MLYTNIKILENKEKIYYEKVTVLSCKAASVMKLNSFSVKKNFMIPLYHIFLTLTTDPTTYASLSAGLKSGLPMLHSLHINHSSISYISM